jgi:hypothetical protein
MNSQLTEITALLNAKSIRHWLDNGTLLGIVRGGDVLKGDRDIDIGTWAESADDFRAVGRELRQRYRMFTQSFRGNRTKVSLIPRSRQDNLRIDFHLYRVKDDHAWYPTYAVVKRSYPRGSFMFFYEEMRKRAVLRYRLMHRRLSAHEDILSPVLRSILHYRVWWVPAAYFQTLHFLESHRVWVPDAFDRYLELHYGNWRQVVTKWNYWTDDKALAFPDVADWEVRQH